MENLIIWKDILICATTIVIGRMLNNNNNNSNMTGTTLRDRKLDSPIDALKEDL